MEFKYNMALYSVAGYSDLVFLVDSERQNNKREINKRQKVSQMQNGIRYSVYVYEEAYNFMCIILRWTCIMVKYLISYKVHIIIEHNSHKIWIKKKCAGVTSVNTCSTFNAIIRLLLLLLLQLVLLLHSPLLLNSLLIAIHRSSFLFVWQSTFGFGVGA